MTVNSRVVDGSPAKVWDVLADGWLYPVWVVGASRMREVTDDWPAVGAKLHHSVGVWPALLDDHTEVLESVIGHSLKLRARAFPAGAAEVLITLDEEGTSTRISIDESVINGPASYIPSPLEAVAMKWRNGETLQRLSFIVEGR